MSIDFTSKDIEYIYFHNLNIIIVFKHDLNGIREINLSFSNTDSMFEQLNKLLLKNNLILDNEFLSRKYISKS